jgi:subtilisin family serine protease
LLYSPARAKYPVTTGASGIGGDGDNSVDVRAYFSNYGTGVVYLCCDVCVFLFLLCVCFLFVFTVTSSSLHVLLLLLLGPDVNIFAPGQDITSAWIGSNTATNTIR